MIAALSQTLSCSLALILPLAPSLTCLSQDMTTVSPSCLGGGWLSVVDMMVLVMTPASHGLQAMTAGPPSTP